MNDDYRPIWEREEDEYFVLEIPLLAETEDGTLVVLRQFSNKMQDRWYCAQVGEDEQCIDSIHLGRTLQNIRTWEPCDLYDADMMVLCDHPKYGTVTLCEYLGDEQWEVMINVGDPHDDDYDTGTAIVDAKDLSNPTM